MRASTDGGVTWNPDWTDLSGSGATTTSHTLTSLTNDTAYTVELRAFRGETAGAAASASATPSAPRYEPDPDLIADVWTYAQETEKGFDYVLRWMRTLHTFGVLRWI